MSKLEICNLTKRFSGLVAVNNVDLSFGGDEIVGIIGPNGAGKTTLINLVSGIFYPSSGQIFMDGTDITTMPAHKRTRLGVGRTFQLIHPLEDLSTIENIMIGFIFSQGLSKKEAKEKSEILCNSLDLERWNRSVSQLNILEIKKMEIAQALATNPGVLFLDEVMAGLNSDELKELIGLIKKVAKEKTIAIGIVEHVMGVIRELADRVVVLENGAVLADGSFEEVMKNPDVIAAYLGGSHHA